MVIPAANEALTDGHAMLPIPHLRPNYGSKAHPTPPPLGQNRPFLMLRRPTYASSSGQPLGKVTRGGPHAPGRAGVPRAAPSLRPGGAGGADPRAPPGLPELGA